MYFRGIQSIVLGLMCYRAARYILAVGFLLFAIPITIAALEETDIEQRSGIATNVHYYYHNSTGMYSYSELTLEGSSTTYNFMRNEFTDILPEQRLEGARVDIWAQVGPLEGTPHIVAIRLYDTQGGSKQYLTDIYAHADEYRNRELVPGIVLWCLVLICAGAGAFAPVARMPTRGRQSVPINASSEM